MSTLEKSPRRGMPLLVRGIVLFLLFALLVGGLYWFCLHHYRNVAKWNGTGEGQRDSLLYGGEEYLLAAKVGSSGIPVNGYTKSDLLGEVSPAVHDAFRYSYPVYSVKASAGKLRDGYLIVVYEDGDSYLYYRQGMDNPYRPPETDIDSDTPDEPDDDLPVG